MTLLETNEKVGRKLFITGKGRCNVCNNCDVQELSLIHISFLAVLELSKTRRIRLEGDGEEMELMLTNDNTK